LPAAAAHALALRAILFPFGFHLLVLVHLFFGEDLPQVGFFLLLQVLQLCGFLLPAQAFIGQDFPPLGTVVFIEALPAGDLIVAQLELIDHFLFDLVLAGLHAGGKFFPCLHFHLLVLRILLLAEDLTQAGFPFCPQFLHGGHAVLPVHIAIGHQLAALVGKRFVEGLPVGYLLVGQIELTFHFFQHVALAFSFNGVLGKGRRSCEQQKSS
jgi:hypothetical protein